MTQLAFYVVSDVHGFIFPTDFSHRDVELPMGLLKLIISLNKTALTMTAV